MTVATRTKVEKRVDMRFVFRGCQDLLRKIAKAMMVVQKMLEAVQELGTSILLLVTKVMKSTTCQMRKVNFLETKTSGHLSLEFF